MVCMLQTINKKISLKRNHVEIKPQRRSSRMTKLPFWSEELSSRNPGGAGYDNLHFVQQPCRPQPARSPEVAHGKVLMGATGSLPVPTSGLPHCLLLPFPLTFLTSLKSQNFTIDGCRNCSFCKDISELFHFCYPQPVSPNVGWYQAFGEKSFLPKAICRCGRSPPALTVLPQREPLHHKRELRNYTKTNFSLLVIIQWSLHQWGP